jgi:hypothetical protein
MINLESYRQNAADCVRQAESEAAPEDKNLLLNVALAWVRLAHQVQEVGIPGHSDRVIEHDANEAKAESADAGDKAATPNDDSESEPEKPLVTH